MTKKSHLKSCSIKCYNYTIRTLIIAQYGTATSVIILAHSLVYVQIFGQIGMNGPEHV